MKPSPSEFNRRLYAVSDAHVDTVSRPIPAGMPGAAPSSERPSSSPLQRLSLLCDEGSLQTIRSEVASERMGDRARAGDGVVGAAGRIGGRPVFCYAQDARYAGGSVGAAHADTIVAVQRLARRWRAPVIGFVESGGARMQEGLAALDGYGRIFAENVAMSGDIPQISVVTGTSAGGGCYSPALTDFVIMTEPASMFLTGPGVVEEVTACRSETASASSSPIPRSTRSSSSASSSGTSRATPASARPCPRRRSPTGRSRAPACRRTRAAPMTSATPPAASPTPARFSRSRPAGRRTSSRCWPGSTGGRSASSPTSPATWAA
jgi:hypothetical protein